MDVLEQQTMIYLSKYEKAVGDAENRLKRCCICGDLFDRDEGKDIPIWKNLHTTHHYICNGCLESVEEIEDEFV